MEDAARIAEEQRLEAVRRAEEARIVAEETERRPKEEVCGLWLMAEMA